MGAFCSFCAEDAKDDLAYVKATDATVERYTTAARRVGLGPGGNVIIVSILLVIPIPLLIIGKIIDSRRIATTARDLPNFRAFHRVWAEHERYPHLGISPRNWLIQNGMVDGVDEARQALTPSDVRRHLERT